MTAASSPPPRDGEVCPHGWRDARCGRFGDVGPCGCVRPAVPSEPPAADSPTPGTETLPWCNLPVCPEPREHRITTGRCLLIPAAPSPVGTTEPPAEPAGYREAWDRWAAAVEADAPPERLRELWAAMNATLPPFPKDDQASVRAAQIATLTAGIVGPDCSLPPAETQQGDVTGAGLMRNRCAFTSRDMSDDWPEAFTYAVVAGWDSDDPDDECDAMAEVAAKFGWDEALIDFLRDAHRRFSALADRVNQPQPEPCPVYSHGESGWHCAVTGDHDQHTNAAGTETW